MKDWPITYRIMVLFLLLFSLLIVIRELVGGSEGELPIGAVDRDGLSDGAVPELPEIKLYPAVPPELPDLNEKYLFNSERIFEADEVEIGGDEFVDLAEVVYTGSLIVGNIRVGLITYQDQAGNVARTAPGVRGRTRRRPSTQTVTKNKQLAVGEKFRGYVVEKVEKDRLVLKKGDEKIVKFLYDSDKDRTGVGEAIRSQPGRSVKDIQGNQVPPATGGVRQNLRRPREVEPPAQAPPSGERTIRSRSELLRGLDPNLRISPPPGAPGDPLRR